MKKLTTFLIVFFTIINIAFADVGDTIVVQTIDYNTPTLSGWNQPRSGTYLFPADSISFSKILMVYNLKCDPTQSPACGEWDYTTRTKIFEVTGEIDSTLYHHPNYIVYNQSPDTFMYMNSPSYTYLPFLEYTNSTSATNSATPGDGQQQLTIAGSANAVDGKLQFVYSADELITAGLLAGEITAVNFNVVSGSSTMKHFTIQLANITESLISGPFYTDNMTTVYNKNTDLVTGDNNLNFSFPYNWDGTSDVLVSVSYADNSGAVDIVAEDAISSVSNESPDNNLYFNAWDYVNVPGDVFETIDSAITISFWQYGDPDIQPINSSIFEGVDSLNRRVLNSHLPWSDSKVYWDAGFNGYDRLFRSADTEEYEGQWNFYTFTKDIETGYMYIYLNGEVWSIINSQYVPVSNVTNFRIGAAITYNGYYSGAIDEFRIWDTALTQEQIMEWMYKEINDTHPAYEHLRAYYQFDEGNGYEVADSGPYGFNATQFGYPEWQSYNGINKFKNSSDQPYRFHLTFENGNYNSATLDSTVMIDTIAKTAVNIVMYDPNNPPMATDTLAKWPSYYNNYVYDAGAIAIDSTMVTPDDTLFMVNMPYYGEPYDVNIPWEIGRFITPYGNNLSLGDDGFTWIYDVTDYRHLLVDSLLIKAGNFQELLDLEFHMIEGTPSREVLSVDKLSSGTFQLKSLTANVPPDTVDLLPEAQSWRVKTRTSGHLFDNPTNCAEFCSKLHSVDVNGTIAHEWQILQECAENPLYPQGGTWIYDRAGWCPGMKVTEQDVEITPFINADTAIIDYNSQYDFYGNYVLEVHLISYGPYNFQYDAGVDEIIAPNNEKRYGRYNPSASAPIIVIANYGSEILTSLDITYGPAGEEKTYNWTGEIQPSAKKEITLEAFDWVEWQNGNGSFSVVVSNPNNHTDENEINNMYHSKYELPDVYPATIIVHFKTNKAAYQNSYEFRTSTGTTLFTKDDFENSTLYVDTITFVNGCYDFYMFDTGDNGISFWANTQGSGYLKFYDIEGNYIKSFNGDFGDRIYNSFYADMYIGILDNTKNNIAIDIIPNPNNGVFAISYATNDTEDMDIVIYNGQGSKVKVIKHESQTNGTISVNMSDMAAGVYTCVMTNKNGRSVKKFIVK